MVRRPGPQDGEDPGQSGLGGTQRLDKWLFFCRMVKTRPLAADLVRGGHVRVNGDKAKTPAKTIRPGDVITVALERRVAVLRMLAPGERRGSYPEARVLYEDLAPTAAGDEEP